MLASIAGYSSVSKGEAKASADWQRETAVSNQQERIRKQRVESDALQGTIIDLAISTARGTIHGVLHTAINARSLVIMVGGAGGGVKGPAGIYEPLAGRLQADGVAALRLDYRHPNKLNECVYDVLTVIKTLRREGAERVALIGWSFGGAVVISAGARSSMVVGVATVASQTFGTQAVGELSPKSLLLIHGTADRVLPAACSRELYRKAGEPKELVLYAGNDHSMTRHWQKLLDKLHGWSTNILVGVPVLQ